MSGGVTTILSDLLYKESRTVATVVDAPNGTHRSVRLAVDTSVSSPCYRTDIMSRVRSWLRTAPKSQGNTLSPTALPLLSELRWAAMDYCVL